MILLILLSAGIKEMHRFSYIAKLAVYAQLAIVSGCAGLTHSIPKSSIGGIYDPFTEEIDQPAPAAGGEDAPVDIVADETSERRSNLIYYRGRTGVLGRLSEPRNDALQGRMLQLNFADAPAGDVARAVIRESLGETLSVADGVSGVITLTAPEAVPARDALDALERALAESNLALIEIGPGFLLTTMQSAAQTPQTPGVRSATGFSTTIVPVDHAVPSEIAGMIQPFLTERLMLTPNDLESTIAVRGPTVDIQTALDAIETFDAPYLTDRIFGLFRLEFVGAQTIQEEVAALLETSGITTGGVSDLIAMPRLNLLFASARTREEFAEIRGWIDRLDRPSGGDERRLRYYSVQYTPAEDLAAQLNAAFSGAPAAASQGFSRAGGQDGADQSQTQNRFQQGGLSLSSSSSGERANITPDTLNNALLIRATDREYAEVLDLIEKMDVPPAQVLIEATIAEVTLTDNLSFGVRWFFENAESDLEFSTAGNLNPVFPGLNYSFIDGNVGFALNTLSSVTEVNVLSAPSIVVLNNQSANLQVGDEVPILNQQAIGDGDGPIISNVQLRETGVILEVSPRINASDFVVLEVTQEVSEVAETESSGIDSPTIQQRRFTSTVSVADKGTVLLGGLIRESVTENASGVPVLKDVPILGNAFKSSSVNKRRTELLVFLTPHIIRNEYDGQIAFRRLRRQLDGLYDDPPPTN